MEDTAVAPEGPDIAVDVAVLDLGRAPLGGELTATLEVWNRGDDTLTLEAPVLDDATVMFSLGELPTIYVRAGESLSFDIHYAASQAGAASARLLLPSDDADEPVTELVLVAHATAAAIALDPAALDFGTVEERCVDTHGVVLRNDGDDTLTVTDLSVSGGGEAFQVDPAEADNGPLPWTLAPGASARVWVTFEPPRAVEWSGTLVVRSNDPDEPSAAVQLDGVATENARIVDNFFTAGAPLDIVFALGGDDPDTLAASLLDALPALTGPLSAANADYQIAALRRDDGCLVNGLLVEESMTADEQAAALEGLLAASGGEHTLTVLERAMVESTATGCNPDLVRPGAHLALIGVIDVSSAAPQAAGVYSSAFEGMKPDADVVAAWAFGPDGGTCGAADGAWVDVATATGGAYLSICDDFATNLATLAEGVLDRQTSFPLSRVAWPDTLVVQVDGVTTRDHAYDTTTNAITFEGASAPLIGASVRAIYDAIPVCDSG